MRVFLWLLLCTVNIVFGQVSDTVNRAMPVDSLRNNFSSSLDTSKMHPHKLHSPLKAIIFSAALPGLGQGYNKKYWKIPIIYAGFGVASYFLYTQNKKYQCFRRAYQLDVDGDPLTDGICGNYRTEYQLEQGKNYYRRNVDLISAVMVIWYALNLVDAAVDAHLFNFDVGDDLSLQVAPDFKQFQAYNKSTTAFGLQLKLQF